ncbi:MAG: putative ABC transporter phosphite binding protein PhnD1 [Planctomycetes bacterium]|nr:putative ABC transporter phosphite binding protein PhnD1 [Planctomycetota bacterium]MCQ3948562.1 phosphate/phosphite/phosphonate ABC transporter substrate-binding protein [Planctomycetota bacterium]GIK52025.1 MAG: hypothetical protein BroJett014_09980 [Planctomycetota bacterium]HRJ77426.1 phosphate/phosphite/phosphonate ABC transporter substrate-binding protein [Planctomycetota bacterium]
MLKRSLLALKLFCAVAALAAVAVHPVSAAEVKPTLSKPLDQRIADGDIKELRISAIPDSDAKAIEEKCNLVCEMLSKALGIPVKFMPQQNYAACVTGLATDQLDLVWFGGVTGVQADQKMGDKCVFVACRESDKQYKSYYIANKEAKIGPVNDLKELAAKAEGMKFTFGSKSSTSGHVMPRHFFQDQTGEKPEDVFGKDNVAYSGSHDATLRNVAAGTAQIGALNFKNWDNAKDELAKAKDKCELIYTTPFYVDYMWAARTGVGEANIKKIKDAFLALDHTKEADNKILAAWGAKGSKFVACEKKEWDGIRKVLESGVDVG